jgi:hypothetical protein
MWLAHRRMPVGFHIDSLVVTRHSLLALQLFYPFFESPWNDAMH